MRPITVMQLLPALESGGVERTTMEVARALVAAGHRSLVVSAGGRLVEQLVAEGSEHITLDIGRKSLRSLAAAWRLRRLFARRRPDIVHARSRLPGWLAWLALRGAGHDSPRFVTSVHGLNSPGFYSSILTRGERVICVSETVRSHVLRQWPATSGSRISVIEPGLDPAAFDSAASPLASLPATLQGRQVLLMPGRGSRLKGHPAAIRLLAAVVASGADAALWLPGAAQPAREAYIADLHRLAASMGVGERVEIGEAIGDMAGAYRSARLVLQLSERPEAFGRTVVEALACGTPVIGWSQGGVGELLARHFPEGQVAPGDHDALLATTLRMLAARPPLPAIRPQSLADAQSQTLSVYESIAR